MYAMKTKKRDEIPGKAGIAGSIALAAVACVAYAAGMSSSPTLKAAGHAVMTVVIVVCAFMLIKDPDR